MEAADYFGPHGALSRAIKGFEHRPSQIEMTRAVEHVLTGNGVLFVEAGTGTGKTFAYLLPAILSGRRVVVSTGTRALQDQIVKVDMLMLLEQTGLEANVVSLKGLSNYVCKRRFEEMLGSADGVRHDESSEISELIRWVASTDTGERSDFHALQESSPTWGRVSSSTDTRVGPKCAHYESCFVTNARRRAEDADIIVVNHHLFFADLAIRGPHPGSILPDYDAVIFDEAHRIEDVATQFFGSSVSTTGVERLVKELQQVLKTSSMKDATTILLEVLHQASVFFGEISKGRRGSRAAFSWDSLDQKAKKSFYDFDNQLDRLGAALAQTELSSEILSQYARRVMSMRQSLGLLEDATKNGHVGWLQSEGRRVSVGTSPVDVSPIMRERVFEAIPSVVLTSATLTSDGKFDFIKARLGANFELEERLLDSPFDYPNQVALYVPSHLPDPRNTEYAEMAANEILSLIEITGGGAFVLCTSVRMMEELARVCRPRLKQPSMVQGDAPKHVLLERFKQLGDAVLFATSSFWEGVDVQGDALRLVIIDKLPFEVPSDPLVQARCKRLEEAKESAFMKYLVPSAALSLKQAFGRLIRSKRDRGIVAVLDQRLAKKGYGKVLLRSLPPGKRCNSIDEVREFWADGKSFANNLPDL